MSNDASIKVNPWLIAAAVVLPTFMEVLDTTIVSVALPYIAGNLSASSSQATWVQTSYLISNAIVLPASAWFSAFFGRKRYFMVSIAVFAVASLLSGVAPSLGFLVAAQLLMGAGGGALQPLSQAILMESFPREQRGQAMSVWALGVVVAPVLGPVAGGWITDHYSWRWLFFINVPVSAAALWMIQQFIVDPPYLRDVKPGRIDAIGFGLLALWLATMQTVLDKGQEDDWFSAEWICWFSLISIISLITLIIWELREKSPIINLRVLTNRNFFLGFIIVTLIGILSYSPLTLLPLFQQNLLGYTALQSGLAQYPRGIGSLLVLPLVGFLSSRVDNRIIILAGIVLSALAALMLGNINLEVAKTNFNLANLIQGAGVAIAFVPLATTAMGLLPNEQMGNATGLFSLMRNLGGSIGISMVTTMLARGAQVHQTMLVAHLTPFDPNFQAALQANQAALAPGVGPVQAQLMAPGMIYTSLLQQSSLLAYVDDFRRLAFLTLISFPAVLLMKRAAAKRGVAVH
jgi:DHA2 family multidrug resistance protein